MRVAALRERYPMFFERVLRAVGDDVVTVQRSGDGVLREADIDRIAHNAAAIATFELDKELKMKGGAK